MGFEVDSGSVLELIFVDVKNKDSVSLPESDGQGIDRYPELHRL
jgi:hypothetical protein